MQSESWSREFRKCLNRPVEEKVQLDDGSFKWTSTSQDETTSTFIGGPVVSFSHSTTPFGGPVIDPFQEFASAWKHMHRQFEREESRWHNWRHHHSHFPHGTHRSFQSSETSEPAAAAPSSSVNGTADKQ